METDVGFEENMNGRPSIFIFSYNRGGHLRLCVESALRHASECRIVVIDDASTDPATVEFLDHLPDSVECVRRKTIANLRHGGLYRNMQTALDMAGDSEFVMFVQDDLQFVREMGPEDRDDLSALCRADPPAFVSATFLCANRSAVQHAVLADDGKSFTYDIPDIVTGRCYADVMAFSPARIRSVGWRFEEGEMANSQQADRLLGAMRYMSNPIIMYSPRPIAYRGRSRGPFIRVLERIRHYGVYKFISMSPAESLGFRERKKSELPVAENFLSLEGISFPKPWEFDIFQSGKLILPLYHMSTHPLRYLRYQIAKRLHRSGAKFE